MSWCRVVYATLFIILVLATSTKGTGEEVTKKISAVFVTTSKDTRAFEKSIVSALKHLVDVDQYYIISPDAAKLEKLLRGPLNLGKRVNFIDEKIFPFDWRNVSSVMIGAVEEKGVYPLNDKSPFEHTVWGRSGWFLQQLLKLYAGKILGLGDYVLLDSDLVWFRDVSFINETKNGTTRFNYAVSSQYHGAYVSTLQKVAGVPLYKNPDMYRSGIVHHMVLAEPVLNGLMRDSETFHGGLPFWKILLNQSAIELTCRAPRTGICGQGSTLSEYDLYFNYARQKYPETVNLRPLMWANGPMPGLMYWPPIDTPAMKSDVHKSHWVGHRQSEVPQAFLKQMRADHLMGYDYAGYHGYARRRYYELIDPDIEILCKDAVQPRNTTCSWHGYEDNPILQKERSAEDWFAGCACWLANHQGI